MNNSLDITNTVCPLCSGTKTREYGRDKRRDFIQCRVCDLVFVPAGQHLSMEKEKEIRPAPKLPGR